MLSKETKNTIYELVKKECGDATCVDISVNSEGMEVNVNDRHMLKDYSMRTIDGEWVCKAKQ